MISSERISHHDGESGSQPEVPIREYLTVTDISDRMIELTLQAYGAEAALFANKEWSVESIQALLDGVFEPVSEIIERFIEEHAANPDIRHQVLFLGCGNAAEAAILALLVQSVYVNACDISPEMLGEGLKRLKYRQLVTLVDTLKSLNNGNVFWIEEIVSLADEVKKYTQKKTAKMVKKRAIKIFRRRLKLIQADMLKLDKGRNFKNDKKVDLTEKQYNLAMAIASVPHLPKTKLLDFVDSVLEILLPGGTFFFNIRLDEDQSQEQGRVFTDTVLNRKARYFTTYVLPEIANYMYQLTGQPPTPLEAQNLTLPPNGRCTLILTTTKNIEIEVEFTGITPHPDPLKPSFLGIKLTRIN